MVIPRCSVPDRSVAMPWARGRHLERSGACRHHLMHVRSPKWLFPLQKCRQIEGASLSTAVGVRAGHRSVPVSVRSPRPIPCAGPCALAPHPIARAIVLEHTSVKRSFAHASRSACCSVQARVQEFERFTFTAIEFAVGVKLCQQSSSFSVRSDLCGGSTLKFDACRCDTALARQN